MDFAYLVADIERVDVPPYFYQTLRTSQDCLWTHVAAMYLSDNDHEQFVEKAYPKIAEELERKLPGFARTSSKDQPYFGRRCGNDGDTDRRAVCQSWPARFSS